MNSKKSKTSYPHRLIINHADKINLKRSDKYAALLNPSMYYTWKNIKKLYKNNRFKISDPTWNEEFELPDGSYSTSDIQDNFAYIFKKHGEKSNDKNPSIKIYGNKIENRITFEIKTGYYIKPLTPETMELLVSTKSKITKDWNSENVSHLEINEVLLIHFNFVSNKYQQNSKLMYTFIPNKYFGQLLDSLYFWKLSEFSYIEFWFTDQNY